MLASFMDRETKLVYPRRARRDCSPHISNSWDSYGALDPRVGTQGRGHTGSRIVCLTLPPDRFVLVVCALHGALRVHRLAAFVRFRGF
jgi:hypothetical protein